MNEHGQLLMKIFGYGFIASGSFWSFFNWVFFFADKANKRRGIDRNVSMVPVMGLGLPLGCLLIEPLRWHALWVGFLDPCFVWIFYLIPGMAIDMIEVIRGIPEYIRFVIEGYELEKRRSKY